MFSLLLFGLLVSFTVLYTISLAVSRLFLSPVASIPGPKLAAFSFWYEFYYDVILRGRYTWKTAQLHEEHCPIVRINPFEVYINDPDFYDEVYPGASKRRTEQWSWTVSLLATYPIPIRLLRVQGAHLGTYSILSDASVLEKLMGELESAMPSASYGSCRLWSSRSRHTSARYGSRFSVSATACLTACSVSARTKRFSTTTTLCLLGHLSA